jgi:hypothetical protein
MDLVFHIFGDTEGFDRIAELRRQQVNAMYIDMTTKCAIARVEGELAKFAVDGAETEKLISGEADIADVVANMSAADDRNETNGDLSVEYWSENCVNLIAERAIVEIKNNEKTTPNHRGRKESTAEIVGRITKAEIAVEIERLQAGIPASFKEEFAKKSAAVDKMVASVKSLYGADSTRDMLAQVSRNGIEMLLARLGDLLTPERYAAEVQFSERLDGTIEVCHDRLMKYQAARTKKVSGNISSLQPGWARKR